MSAEGFLSPSWYRLAQLRPSLKPQARIRRHRYRGVVWYVVQDPASGRFNRFTPQVYQLLGMMDGHRTMDEVWTEALETLDDDAPGQEEVIRLLSQLHAADLLHCEVNPDSAELFERFGRQERARRHSRWKNPFSIRIPIWDPDKFLARTLPYIQPFFGLAGLLLFCLIAVSGLALAVVHWPELTLNVNDRVLAAQNLLLLWVCFPVVKLMHELGHAYVAKARGGEVHDMGILLLVFMPVPYVDASSASGFRSKWRRALVGAAGMLTELLIASIAMMVWAAAEPGWVRATAFNVMLIAGVSTVVFNGNPLLRFDGYYILADLLEMPNLASRGVDYWRYLAERYLFRLKQAQLPLLAPGERGWMLVFTPAAFIYRIFVLFAIVTYIASQWFFFGVVLAIIGLIAMFGVPAVKLFRYVLGIPRAQGARQRAVSVFAACLVLIVVVLTLVPMPMRIRTEGVVWLPEEAQVRTQSNGFVHAVLAAPGAEVALGTPLIESRNPVLAAQLAVAAARVAELEAKLDAERFNERVQAEITRQDLERELAAYRRLRERSDQLVARSGAAGRFVIDRPEDVPGRYVRKGEVLGYIAQNTPTVVRAVVSQDDVDLVRSGVKRVEVRLAERMDEVYPAKIAREVPAARDQLPSAALSSEGGGVMAADPRDGKSGKTLASSFQFDLELAPGVAATGYGGRVYVRFVRDPEPLAFQWYRRVRQAFLARFHV